MYLSACNVTKIFTFEKSNDESLSYATLQASETSSFPGTFIFCNSHLETSIDGTSFFTIYGEDGKPWLTMSIYDSNGKTFLWSRIRSTWKRVVEMKRFWLNFWIHVCLAADTRSGNLNVTVNGKIPINIKADELSIQTPNRITEEEVSTWLK
jgi:hypothetical protein